MNNISPAEDIAVRPRELKRYAGIGKTKVYNLIQEGKWPKPHKLGEGPTAPVYWRLSEIREALRNLEVRTPSETPICGSAKNKSAIN